MEHEWWSNSEAVWDAKRVCLQRALMDGLAHGQAHTSHTKWLDEGVTSHATAGFLLLGRSCRQAKANDQAPGMELMIHSLTRDGISPPVGKASLTASDVHPAHGMSAHKLIQWTSSNSACGLTTPRPTPCMKMSGALLWKSRTSSPLARPLLVLLAFLFFGEPSLPGCQSQVSQSHVPTAACQQACFRCLRCGQEITCRRMLQCQRTTCTAQRYFGLPRENATGLPLQC